jgi:FMN-dependent oxidoreductase (nitrilotriacetate monooxygenase family)
MPESAKKLKLGAFLSTPGNHLAGWRHPEAVTTTDMDFSQYVHLAQLAEHYKYDTIFFQDTAAVNGSRALARGDFSRARLSRIVKLEPTALLAALAAVTTHIGLIATMTTTYNEPYNVARRFASIDHISGGRAGWNLVTSQIEDEAQNFGFEEHLDHAKRYARASEFFDVVVGLWDSWEDGGLLRDKASGIYMDRERVHFLDHDGEHFRVRGPLNVARTPQGRPVVAQAGSSEAGRELAAKTADVIFTAQTKLAEAQAFYADVKSRVAKYGRVPDDIKIMPGITPVIGATEAEARERYEELQELLPDDVALQSLSHISGGLDLTKFPLDGPLPDLPPSNAAKARQELVVRTAREKDMTLREIARHTAAGTGHRVLVGTAEYMADELETWLRCDAADGFNVICNYYHQPFEDFSRLVIPELRRRGVFRAEYEGTTLRENLGLRVPENRYTAARRSAAAMASSNR